MSIFLKIIKLSFFMLLLLKTTNLIASDDEKINYYEDNYVPTSYENFPAEFDQKNVYWPMELNDSRFVIEGKTYIHGWLQDPPNSFTLIIYDSRSTLYSKSEVDIKIITGIWDDTRNLIPENTSIVTHSIVPGWNKVKINIHNYKAQIVSASLIALRTKSDILMLELKDKT